MDYKYTGDDFDIKKAPTKVKDSADELDKIKEQMKKIFVIFVTPKR